MLDLSELIVAAKNKCKIIRAETIRVKNNELIFDYTYLSHLPTPFDSYYDAEKKELHLIIQSDAFPFGSGILEHKISIPEGAEKLRVDYRGKDIRELSPQELIKKYFPNLNFSNE